MSLAGMVALATGGGRGIGRGIAVGLARAGADVAVADVTADAAAETVNLVEQVDRRTLALGANVADYIEARSMVQQVANQFGRLDIAANNAGVAGLAKVADMNPAEWDRVLSVNLRGVWRGENGAAGQRALPGETEEQSWTRQKARLTPQSDTQTPEDIADMVVYLTGARPVTGQALAVDGGHTL